MGPAGLGRLPPMTAQWQLFLDESGKFRRGDDTVVVAGVLVRVGHQQKFQQVLRELLDNVFPGVPYPPHATELNREQNFSIRQQREEGFFQLCEALREHLGPSNIFVVGAGETSDEDRQQEFSPTEAGQRYRSLMVALLERTVALLRGDQARREQVWVHALAPFFEGTQGHPPFHYSRAMLVEDLRRATALPRRTALSLHGHESVFLTEYPLYSWNARTPPGLVLADFVANRLRSALRPGPGLLPLESQFSKKVGFFLSAVPQGWPAHELPSLAATGAPQEALRQAFLLRPPPHPWLPGVTPRWSREQGMKWLSIL